MAFGDTEMTEEERRRALARDVAEKMIGQAEGTAADEGDSAQDAARALITDADERAIASLARGSDDPPAPPGSSRIVSGIPAESRERVMQVDQRLRAPGGRRAVEQQVERDVAGEAEDRAIDQMARPAVTSATPAPMAQEARGTGSDPSMALSLPDPASARRRPQSLVLEDSARQQLQPWWEEDPNGEAPDVFGARGGLGGEALTRPSAARPESMGPATRGADLVEEPAPSAAAALGSPVAPQGARALGDPTVMPEADDAAIEALAGREAPRAPVAKPDISSLRSPGDIPRDGDIRDAQVRDAIRSPFRGIAAALLGATGRRIQPREAEADTLRQRQASMLGEKRTALRQEASDARAQRQQEAQQALAGRQADRADMQLELAQQAAARQDATAQAQAAALAERTAGQRAERELAAERRTPGTAAAQRARTELEVLIDALPPQGRDRALAALGVDRARLSQMSAEEIGNISERLPQFLRDELHRRGGSRAGGGGPSASTGGVRDMMVESLAGPDATPEQRAQAEQRADSLIRTLGPRRAAQSLLSDRLTRGRAEEQGERIDDRQERQRGTRLDRDVRQLGTELDRSLRFRQSLRAARGIDPRLLRAVLISADVPAGFTPAQVQAARAVVNNLQGVLAQDRSGAAVSEPEFARIRNEMGVAATSSPEVFQQWLARQEANSSELNAHIRARYPEDIVTTYDGNLRREQAPAAPGEAPTGRSAAPSAGDTITVRRRSDGRTRPIPRRTWDALTPEQRQAYEAVQ